MYRTKLGNHSRVITITWCRNLLLLHGLSVTISSPYDEGRSSSSSLSSDGDGHYTCKVELKPWYFWRKHGSKSFAIDDGKKVDVFWDLKSAKFNNGETEPSSEYFVALVYENEIVLLVGDLKNEAYKKTGCRPCIIEPILVTKKEHIFGKKKFLTKAKFHEKGRFHDIVIECKNNKVEMDLEMEVKVDGKVVIEVKHLQWKFRGNGSIHLNRLRVEVYWDVHDWLFSPGLRHALFIFKPIIPLSSSKSLSSTSPMSLSSSLSSSLSLSSTPLSSLLFGSSGSLSDGLNGNGSSEFCLFLYAWKVE
ncbi:uncharacterized protein LOC110727455 [Chenopodium quinoa]|uniref:uncharacterized protein LOC110727455 n=1 Tax=Chenopodium quinoa TaxID=63459 RepID=UPI000B77ED41|nr:uncharacterized protein LOC110727455 [Chenopodium quinoa]